METVTRRLELLKLEGLGFSQVEIVKELSQKNVSKWSKKDREDFLCDMTVTEQKKPKREVE